MHFLTAPRIENPKQAQTCSMLRIRTSNMPLFLTDFKLFTPKMPDVKISDQYPNFQIFVLSKCPIR